MSKMRKEYLEKFQARITKALEDANAATGVDKDDASQRVGSTCREEASVVSCLIEEWFNQIPPSKRDIGAFNEIPCRGRSNDQR